MTNSGRGGLFVIRCSLGIRTGAGADNEQVALWVAEHAGDDL